jgi:magnesium-transporting ATPase (P-type)
MAKEIDCLESAVDIETGNSQNVHSEDSLTAKRLEQDIKDREQDRDQRKEFSIKIFWFLVVYIVVVFAYMFFSGFGLMDNDTSVLITLLTTTTANVIGIFILVVKYLFSK